MELEFPLTAPVPLEPAPEFATLRRSCPVARVRLPSGDRAWLVTGYAGNRSLFADPLLSRAASAAEGAPRLRAAPLDPCALTTMDPPEHTRIRRTVMGAFTASRVEAMRPGVDALANTLLDDLRAAGPPGDLVAGYARPLSIAVIGELLGVPEGDRPRFRRWTEDHLGTSPEAIRAADAALRAYFTDLIADGGGDGLIGALATENRLSRDELVSLGITLIVAGYETVANTIAAGTVVLLLRPPLFTRLRDHPGLVPSAVEELLRFTPISVSGGTIRVATGDTAIGDVPIRTGEAVLPATVSANRDAAVFPDPDVFDIARDPNPHIAFGHGIHRCLGAHLARMELQVAFGVLAARLPSLRLAAPLTDIPWRRNGMIRGPRELPVMWDSP
ncbi:cytochrome P450 [Rhizohabitans arisaemae]|uniref:cytochrome P450 n=1 Tax=Rhizohabitans arisaemae TaxID=2720610 RepID=UPI0024B0784C|nr:cytochrome P450 [Rhizohabitans arisaemae]